MTPILLLIRRQISPRHAAAHTCAAGAGLYTQQITLCHNATSLLPNTPQTFEHRAFPRFGRDIGGLDLAFSESFCGWS